MSVNLHRLALAITIAAASGIAPDAQTLADLVKGAWTSGGPSFDMVIQDRTILFEFDMKEHPYRLEGETLVIEETVRGLEFPSHVIIRPVFFMENLTSTWFLNGDGFYTALNPATVLQMIAVKREASRVQSAPSGWFVRHLASHWRSYEPAHVRCRASCRTGPDWSDRPDRHLSNPAQSHR